MFGHLAAADETDGSMPYVCPRDGHVENEGNSRTFGARRLLEGRPGDGGGIFVRRIVHLVADGVARYLLVYQRVTAVV